MAELLIYNTEHWMDALTGTKIDEYVVKNPKFMEKYNARQEKGDIVDVKEDGHWTGAGRGYDKDAFEVVVLKGVPVEDVKHLSKPLLEDHWELEFDEHSMKHIAIYKPKIRKKFKYNLAISYTPKQEIFLNDIMEKTIG